MSMLMMRNCGGKIPGKPGACQLKILKQPKKRGEYKFLIKPFREVRGHAPPGKFFIFGFSELAGNASKTACTMKFIHLYSL